MKKKSVLLVALVVTMLFPTMVFARGHHGGQSTRQQSYRVCAIEDCQKTVWHRHASSPQSNHDGYHHGRGHHQRIR